MTDAERERMRAKIAALRAKTTANGCTEAEALAAARLAAEMMQRYRLSEADVAMGEARVRGLMRPPGWHADIAAAAAFCTDTSPLILEEANAVPEYVFFGREPGPEIALYLRDVCIRAVDSGIAEFKSSPEYQARRLWLLRNRAERDFTEMFVGRLIARLVEIFGPGRNDQARRAAIVHRDRRYAGGRPVLRPNHHIRDAAAAAAGTRAADQVGLHHATARNERASQIGGMS